MPDGDRSKRFSPRLAALIAALVLAALTVSGAVLYGLSQQIAYDQEAQDRIADYAKHSREQIARACFAFPGLNQVECVSQAYQKSSPERREYERRELDLVAQQKMALWTAVMGVAAMIGMALSAVGVWLVWTTFRETRRQAQIAQDNLDALYESERATLHAIAGDVGTIGEREEQFVALEIKNKGRSAGRIIELGGNGPAGEEGPNEAPRWTVVPAGESEHIPAFAVPPKNAFLTVDCWIKYRSVGPKIHTSYFTVKVRWLEPPDIPGVLMMPRWTVQVSNPNGHPDDT